jgi:hypothetical protein
MPEIRMLRKIFVANKGGFIMRNFVVYTGHLLGFR